MRIAIVGPSDGCGTLASFARRYGESICADTGIHCFERVGDIPEEIWNLAIIYTRDEDLDTFTAFQKSHHDCDILLWSYDDKWARIGLHLHPMDFLILPISEESFARAMHACRRSWLPGMKTVKGICGADMVRIHGIEIIYIDSIGHNCVAHTEDSEIIVSKSLAAMSRELGDGFVHSRRGCLVNMRYIEAVDEDGVHLYDGTILPAGSRKTADKAAEALEKYNKEIGQFIRGGTIL